MALSLLRPLLRHLSACLLASAALGAAAAPPPLKLTEVAGGFNAPVDITFARLDSTRMYVTQLLGQVRLVKDGVHQAAPFINISGLISNSSEDGLLSIVFHPDYGSPLTGQTALTGKTFYLLYTRASDQALTVARYYRDATNPDIADPASAAILLEIPHPGDPNFGGRLVFGPDGFLYISTGDGGVGPNGEADPFKNSQNQGSRLGKLLRISVNGGTSYTVPASNPNFGMTCAQNRCPEIFHTGLRNPWRFSFDSQTGDLYIGDVGNHSWEEVNFLAAGTPGGRNFGWSIFEGTTCHDDFYFSPAGGACASLASSHTPPVISYMHGPEGDRAVLGGYVYRGTAIPGLAGYYIYGDNSSTRLWAARRVGGVWENDLITLPSSPLTYITSFGQDPAGNVYVLDYGTGKVFRFDAATPPPAVKSDFEGNGMADLLWNNADGRAAIWLMNGTTAVGTAEIIGAGTGWSVVQLADFNGDSRADVVWQHTDGRMAIYLMNGTTATTTTQLLNAASGWSAIHTPDLNGDGRADLVFQNTNGSTAVWLMNGTTVTGGSTIMGAATGWSVSHVADFDGDGRGDLLWRHTDGRAAIWLMNGSAVTATNQIMNAGSGWSVSHTGDMDGNGRADIVWRHTDGSVAIWLMNGTAFVNGSTLMGAGTGWSVARVADFDGNGRGDLFFQHTDGRAAIYLMNGLTPTSTAQILNAGGGWSIKRSGDLNGDGRADIVWQNTNGSTAVWLMNGTTFLSGSQVMGTGTGWTVTAVSQ